MNALSFSSHEPSPGRLPTLIDTVLQQALEEQRLVGAVVLVARDGVLLHQQAAGLADRESARAMGIDTLFRLASVSKPIVSTAALRLVAQGRLQLDAPITEWLPEFRPRLGDGRAATITLRQLLSHTAGLGYRFFEQDGNGPYAQAQVSDGMDHSGISLEENLRRIARVPLQFAPGSAWSYSLATDVVGALIAKVQGSGLDAAIRQLVSVPLQMHDTGFFTEDAARLATAYVSDSPRPHRLQENEVVPVVEGTVGIHFNPSRALDPHAFASGGGGMVGSAGDVLRLLEALRQGRGSLLPAALWDEMARDQTAGSELANAPGFGFGLISSVLRDRERAASPESDGSWRWGGAYGHAWFVDPVQRLSVVALTNTLYEGMSGRFVSDLRDAVYAGLEDLR